MDRLYVQLNRWAATQHEWSYCDCYMVLSDWIMTVHGVDPLAELRGTYGNPDVCPTGRKLRANLIELGEKFFADFPIMQEPAVGDIAMVKLYGHRYLCGAVRIKGNQWALKTEGNGVTVTKHAQPQRIWGIGYEA